jgi:hypothetical protein
MAKQKRRAAECWKYVLLRDRELPVEEQTTWLLRPLTQVERAEGRDNMARIQATPGGGTATITRTHRLTLDLALSNIDAVENFPAGNAVPWPVDREARLAYLDMLDDDDVKEIGNEIWVHSAIGDDVKNS